MEQYPYNRELANVKDLQGVRAMITLLDDHDMEEGIIYFVNDEYLRSVPVNEYPALPGIAPPPTSIPHQASLLLPPRHLHVLLSQRNTPNPTIGKAQISAQPYSQFNNVLGVMTSCAARVTCVFSNRSTLWCFLCKGSHGNF